MSIVSQSIPHARGDGPPLPDERKRGFRYSPRPWGWTAVRVVSPDVESVFPTPVGMDRELLIRTSTRICIPHARGDGPSYKIFLSLLDKYSPRPWGWTDHHLDFGY